MKLQNMYLDSSYAQTTVSPGLCRFYERFVLD